MLKSLSVWNFALIEQLSIQFNNGLNIITGETGAGKSILIDSVGMILGMRTSADNIRTGCEWMRVEAVFDITGDDAIHLFLRSNELVEDDETLIISRRVTVSGKNSITVNGCHVTLALLKRLGEQLVDIHGQHENQTMLRSENQLALVDDGDKNISVQLERYQCEYRKLKELQEEFARREKDSMEQAQRLDMLRWQTEEIGAAELKPGEEDEINAQIKVLSHGEKIAEMIKQSYGLLEGGERGKLAIVPSLAEAKKCIEQVCRYDSRMNNTLKIIDEALCQLEECSLEVRSYGEDIDYDPQKLTSLQERADVIYKMRKKYGATVEAVLQHYDEAKRELEDIENYDEIIKEQQKKIAAAEASVQAEAAKLHTMREKSAVVLAAGICGHLHQLGMPDARLIVEIADAGRFMLSGADEVKIMFSANAGETMRLMQKIASGGELSRIALAIKVITAARDRTGVMIFDEIDTGIGGRTAQMVAERIAMVAKNCQVLCITHLPQIACMADNHLYIQKQVKNGKTATSVTRLSTSGRINELARMASGNDVTTASLDNALEMLNNAKIKKDTWEEKAAV